MKHPGQQPRKKHQKRNPKAKQQSLVISPAVSHWPTFPPLGILRQFMRETEVKYRTLTNNGLLGDFRENVGSSMTNIDWQADRADGPGKNSTTEQCEYPC